MVKKQIILKNQNGLHMRPGQLFVKEAKKQSCAVSVLYKDKTADAKSLVQVLKMGIGKDHTITLLCDGKGEQKSADHLEQFIDTLEE